VLGLAPFKFKVCHTRGADNVVAGALSRMFEVKEEGNQEKGTLAIMQGLPLVYTSLEDS
jgi:hypothetical protein